MIKKSITKLSILCSITGLVLLYACSTRMNSGLTPISQIDEDFVGTKTKVSGEIIAARKHSEGHIFLEIKDRSGGIMSVAIFSNVYSKLDERLEFLDFIELSGRIKEYEGALEIIPNNPGEIRIVHTSPLKIEMIDKTKLGEKVKVRGLVKDKKLIGDDILLFDLQEKNNKLKVFTPNANTKICQKLAEGQKVVVGGTIQLYEGELELRIDSPYNIQPQ